MVEFVVVHINGQTCREIGIILDPKVQNTTTTPTVTSVDVSLTEMGWSLRVGEVEMWTLVDGKEGVGEGWVTNLKNPLLVTSESMTRMFYTKSKKYLRRM